MSEAQRNSPALSWLNGFYQGSEALAGALRAYLDGDVELDKALLMARLACLTFVSDVAGNVSVREKVVRLFRTEEHKNTATEVSE